MSKTNLLDRRAVVSSLLKDRKGMVAVEFLTNLANLPQGAYFLFAAVKIKNCHGGPGRAIALY